MILSVARLPVPFLVIALVAGCGRIGFDPLAAENEVAPDGSTIDASVVDATGPDATVPSAAIRNTRMGAGGSHSCSVQGSQLSCWGGSGFGQLGYGATTPIGDDETPKSAGTVAVGADVVSVSLGVSHTCAILVGGGLRCWGIGGAGRLGYGNVENLGDDETPASVAIVDVGGKVTQVATGNNHTCALLDTGAVRCWGQNGTAQLGYGHTNNIGDDETPASAGDIDLGGTAIWVGAGEFHTCALLDTGSVRCWGNALASQLGYGNADTIGDNETPASAGDVPIGGKAVQLSVGTYHNCVLFDTGGVRCWGFNDHGRLGHGTIISIGATETADTAPLVALDQPVTQIEVGDQHSCALLDSGAVRCWGNALAGRLGYGNTVLIGDDETLAGSVDISLGGTAVELSAGSEHTCALLDTGDVRCWGRGTAGQLGYGNTNNIGDDEVPSSVGVLSLP